MEVACQGGFFSIPLSHTTLEWHFKILYRSNLKLQQDYPDIEEFCRISKEVAKIRYPEYKAKMSSALSGRKKEAVDGSLRDLGYPVLNDINKKRKDYDSERRRAEEELLRTVEVLIRMETDDKGLKKPVFDTYRTSLFGSIAMVGSDVEEPECPEEAQNDGLGVDLLFKNNAAKKAYISWIGSKVETGSICDIARLDAWIFTWIEITRDRIRDRTSRNSGGHQTSALTNFSTNIFLMPWNKS